MKEDHVRKLVDATPMASSQNLAIRDAVRIERKAWARLVRASVDARDALFACENEQPGAETWSERAEKDEAAAMQALRELGVDVDDLLEDP